MSAFLYKGWADERVELNGLANMNENIPESYQTATEHWLSEPDDQDELMEIIDNLSDAETALLTSYHARDYHGTDDDMPDAFESWLMELTLAEIKTILCRTKIPTSSM